MKSDPINEAARESAERFVRDETQFQLGFLETEKPHPKTKGLSKVCLEDLPVGIAMLQNVDKDIVTKAREVLASREFRTLMNSLRRSLGGNGRIFISGCGATGRLAILLEKAWRTACQLFSRDEGLANRLCSMLTGGDYALIRSLESFEDNASFGAEQAKALKLRENDTFIAVSEGGETSSVIGSALYAAEQKARVFFVFNNPKTVLRERIKRSSSALDHPGITPIELCTGQMAVAGSTRMQATTIELLVLGYALEVIFSEVSNDHEALKEADPVQTFERLLESLGRREAVEGIATLVLLEADIYSKQGLVTYFADHLLLDLLTDTTERAPTFMLPPFVKDGDDGSPPSWAFAKNPMLPTEKAWHNLLGRGARCLQWTAGDYRKLGAAERIARNPPAIGFEEMLRFRIGNERDPRRFARSDSTAIAVIGPSDLPNWADFREAFDSVAADYANRKVLQIGGELKTGNEISVPCNIKQSPLRLWEHIAVKLVVNTVSTATMARLGRMESNWMAWVEATNKKLIDRSIRLVSELCGMSYSEAANEIFLSIKQTENADWNKGLKPSPARHCIERLKNKRKTPQ